MRRLRDILRMGYRHIVDSLPDDIAIQVMYFRAFCRFANLKTPQTFNEKVNWRKLYQRDPRFTVFADKVAGKDEVAKLIGDEHVIPTLWVGADPDAIPYETLEPPYVIKVSHSSGRNIFIRDRKDIDKAEISQSMREQLGYSHAHFLREWAYEAIPRRILVERMLVTSSGDVPEDYKFFVYHGRVHFIQVIQGRFADEKHSFLDRDWTKVALATTGLTNPEVTRPESADQLVALAEKIGKDFDFVRVDLYCVAGHVYFSEATFYPAGGYKEFTPKSWDKIFGEPWQLPSSHNG